VSGQLECLRSFARQVCGHIKGERLAGSIAFQVEGGMVVERSRLVLLIIRDCDLAVTDLKIRKLKPAL